MRPPSLLLLLALLLLGACAAQAREQCQAGNEDTGACDPDYKGEGWGEAFPGIGRIKCVFLFCLRGWQRCLRRTHRDVLKRAVNA